MITRALLTVFFAGLSLFGSISPLRAQLVIEEVAGVPGLKAGDPIDAWRRLSPHGQILDQGSLTDPFLLLAVARDQVPRGSVELRARDRWLGVPTTAADLRAEPPLPSHLLASYRRALELLDSEELETRARGLARLATLDESVSDATSRSVLRYRIAVAREAAGDLPAAAAILREAALEISSRSALAEALLRSKCTQVLLTSRNSEEAMAEAELAARAVDTYRERWPVLFASVEVERAGALRSQGRLDVAERLMASALESLERLTPGSPLLARAFRHAAMTAWLADDFETAERRAKRSLSIQEELGSSSWELNFLAILAAQRGRQAEAENLYLRVIEGAPERSRQTYRANLARLYLERGELERARELLTDVVGWHRAQDDLRNAILVAAALGNLAETERRLGNLEAAESNAREAIGILEQQAPESMSAAVAWLGLGEGLRERGSFALAADAFDRSLAVAQRARPGGIAAADAHAGHGAIAFARGDLDQAEQSYQRALSVVRSVIPGTWREAEWLSALGEIEADRGEEEQEPALARYLQAVEVLESLRGRLGGAHEARSGFTSLHHQVYWRPLELLAQQGRDVEAFELLERYRARTFRELLVGREIDFSVDLSPELDAQRRRLSSRYDALLRRLEGSELSSRQELRDRLAQIRLQQLELEDRIRAASPQWSALHTPRPLGEPEARALAAGGTLLLSYAVGPQSSWLFALGPQGRKLEAFALEADIEELRTEVATLRRLVARPSARVGALRIASRSLTSRLLAPAASRLREARHLIVVPDGPLHLVPWAALPDPDRLEDPLIALRSLSIAASGTVLAQLQREKARAPKALVGFGDPLTSDHDRESQAATRVAQRSGRDLGALPWSRREVETLGELYSPGSEIYLGEQVTEERLRAVAPGARRLHLATHAVVDPLLPLESGLVLSPTAKSSTADEGSSNGFLQVFEIYQHLRLDADLVTLSACETAIGQEMSGEGLLGLTRAFHYAGARSVLSSLWQVSDQASALLMERFYRHWLEGSSKAEALRRAQLEILRGEVEGATRQSHPFYWAAFQLYGAWR